jgi:hypothetical protein
MTYRIFALTKNKGVCMILQTLLIGMYNMFFLGSNKPCPQNAPFSVLLTYHFSHCLPCHI